uniref:Uncharacterized protein n=1 Tax=Arundo donax TaxID=35708 RepID=A0A0A9FJA5_ARUDO
MERETTASYLLLPRVVALTAKAGRFGCTQTDLACAAVPVSSNI